MKTTRMNWTNFPSLLGPLDPFFLDGNEVCHWQLKQATIDMDSEELLHSVYTNYRCHEKGCTATFDSISEYESHYNSLHCHACMTCRKNFPTGHFLDIHIRETHDAYFQSMLEKGQATFDCYVQGCEIKLRSSEERWKHLIDVHKYPHDFRFGRPTKTINLTSETSSMEVDELVMDKPESVKTGKHNTPPKVPKSICFGQGSIRTFQRTSQSNISKTKGKQSKNNKDTSITMTELENALDDV